MPRFNTNEKAQDNTPSTPVAPTMSKQEANEKLSEMVNEVYAKLGVAQRFADEHGLNFSLDIEYGMGGCYEEGEWHPSSQSC